MPLEASACRCSIQCVAIMFGLIAFIHAITPLFIKLYQTVRNKAVFRIIQLGNWQVVSAGSERRSLPVSMCNLPIPVCSLPYRRRFQRRGPPRRRIPSNLSYPPLDSRGPASQPRGRLTSSLLMPPSCHYSSSCSPRPGSHPRTPPLLLPSHPPSPSHTPPGHPMYVALDKNVC